MLEISNVVPNKSHHTTQQVLCGRFIGKGSEAVSRRGWKEAGGGGEGGGFYLGCDTCAKGRMPWRMCEETDAGATL